MNCGFIIVQSPQIQAFPFDFLWIEHFSYNEICMFSYPLLYSVCYTGNILKR